MASAAESDSGIKQVQDSTFQKTQSLESVAARQTTAAQVLTGERGLSVCVS